MKCHPGLTRVRFKTVPIFCSQGCGMTPRSLPALPLPQLVRLCCVFGHCPLCIILRATVDTPMVYRHVVEGAKDNTLGLQSMDFEMYRQLA